MRVNPESISIWLREYRANGAKPEVPEPEGVEYARSTPRSGCGPTPAKATENEEPLPGPTDLSALLSPEEQQLIRALFPHSGPDWGAKAYRAAQRTETPERPEASNHIDLVG